jgi:hypothetical protein
MHKKKLNPEKALVQVFLDGPPKRFGFKKYVAYLFRPDKPVLRSFSLIM